VLDAQDQCVSLGESTSRLRSTVTTIPMSNNFSMMRSWSTHGRGQYRLNVYQPQRMTSASCTPPGRPPRLVTVWDSANWQGHITEVEINADGTSTLLSDTVLPLCTEMGGITVTDNCSVIGVLCRVPRRPEDVPGVVDFVGDTLRAMVPDYEGRVYYPFGWINREAPCTQTTRGGCSRNSYNRRDDSMFLLEWAGETDSIGPRTHVPPTSMVCVNKAIGGWYLGSWSVALGNDATEYMFDMKITVGTHEASVNIVVDRDGWTHSPKSAGYSCGAGHTIGNRIAYNPALGTYARFCWTDLSMPNTNFPNQTINRAPEGGPHGMVTGEGRWGTYIQTLGWTGAPDGPNRQARLVPSGGITSNARTEPGHFNRTHQVMLSTEIGGGEGAGTGSRAEAGSPMHFVPRGSAGWLGVGFGLNPAQLGEDGNMADGGDPRGRAQQALSLLKMPASSNQCVASNCTRDGCLVTDVCQWNYLTSLPGHSVWNYNGADGALGFVNLARLGQDADDVADEDEHFLVGYATKVTSIGGDEHPPLEFRIAKVDSDGRVLKTMRLGGEGGGVPSGWGEDDVWARLSNGCVAWPAAWSSAPGARYAVDSRLHVTVICEESIV